MRVRIWGSRGSLPSPGADTSRYGGNTSCVEVRGNEGTVLVLDAGTGIRPLGATIPLELERVDVLLTHLHMDHIQGLGFFEPLLDPSMEVHVWGPASTTMSLRTRLLRYLSPPLFPVHLRDLPCRLLLHEIPAGEVEIGEFKVHSALVCHPGPTVGYRISTRTASLCYLPDHEPALGASRFPLHPEWTSGYELARGVDLLIHDAQYTEKEYPRHVGWGHSSYEQAAAFAALAGVRRFIPFHHDPARTDRRLDRQLEEIASTLPPPLAVGPGREGAIYDLPEGA